MRRFFLRFVTIILKYSRYNLLKQITRIDEFISHPLILHRIST